MLYYACVHSWVQLFATPWMIHHFNAHFSLFLLMTYYFFFFFRNDVRQKANSSDFLIRFQNGS